MAVLSWNEVKDRAVRFSKKLLSRAAFFLLILHLVVSFPIMKA